MPEIVVFDAPGRHNATLEASSARILEGGSWKKQRVVMLLPAAKMMSTKVAMAMRALIFPPNQAMLPMAAIGYEVGDAYSNAIEEIIAHPELSQWEYVFTLEHDNIGPPDGVVRLIAQMEKHPELACIGGLYWTKGEGGVPQIWGDPKDIMNCRPQVPRPGELVECCGTGMGFNLWRMEMFKDRRIERPLFKTYTGIEGKGVGTQDLSFWSKARALGYRCAIDCGVCVGHMDVESGFVW